MRKFNCPESYSSPELIYHAARKQGMDFVTITDHKTISGAMEIAHLPGVFISSEITCYFPEDGCKLHVVVLNITGDNFREILELRKNIYDLVSREKNLALLAEAFKVISGEKVPAQLVIIGDGPFKSELQEILKGYPVIFTGFLKGENLATAYASADVFVFPSTTDTFGNVVLEAQASGLPVIVTDGGGP